MHLYPAIRANMGTWEYYIIKMRMKDIVKEVRFASEIYENKTLDDAIQRSLNEGRVKKEIVKYLSGRPDRFFSSIVVAALGGNPTFHPIEIADNPMFTLIGPGNFEGAFGILTFEDDGDYFALDGQHRLKAIKTLIEQSGDDDDLPMLPPAGFENEEISIIMLVRNEENRDEFLRSYRRIFSSLNRYAKSTDRDTNIIMDEDDAIAILTRRLLNEHEFFEWKGHGKETPKLKTKGKNLTHKEPYFTTLQTLYSMNEILLRTPQRDRDYMNNNEYKQFRRSEDELDSLFDELVIYWDALLAELPVLHSNPVNMRVHNIDSSSDNKDEVMDHLLFWPIGQEMFIGVVRSLLTRQLPDPDKPTLDDVRQCVSIMNDVDWNLHHPPWRGLLIVQPGENWRMRSEARKEAMNIGRDLLRLKLGMDDLLQEELEELKSEWHSMLIPRPADQSEVDDDWEEIIKPLS